MSRAKEATQDRAYGVGIIGSGRMAQDMCHAFKQTEGFRLSSFYDIDESSAHAQAQRYSARAVSSLDELLCDQNIDVVYISVPPQYHCSLFLKALEHKKHVLCEKPLCLSNAEARMMVAASAKAAKDGIITAINFPMAFIPALTILKSTLREGALGELRRIDLVLHFPKWPRPFLNFTPQSWIAQRDFGGPLREISTHFFFALLHLFNDMELITEILSVINYPKESESSSEISANAIMKMKNQSALQLDLLANFAGTSEKIELRFLGSRRSVSLENFQFLRTHDGEPLGSSKFEACHDPHAFMDSAPVVEELRKAVLGFDHCLVPIAMGEATQRILNALFASDGAWVKP